MRCAQVHLYVCPIEQGRPSARSAEEVGCLTAHASFFQSFLEYSHVAWLQCAHILLHLGIVGIHLILPRFMSYHGHISLGIGIGEVHLRIWIGMIQQATIIGIGKRERCAGMSVVRTPRLRTHPASSEVVLAIEFPLIAQEIIRTSRMEDLWEFPFEGTQQLAQILRSPHLVAQSEHHERGVVAIGFLDMPPLLQEEGHQSIVRSTKFAPDRQLWLQVDTLDISGLEASLRRAPRVEAVVVDAILLGHLEVVSPSLHIHGCMACERKDAGIVLSTEERVLPVDGKLLSLGTEGAQAEVHRLLAEHLFSAFQCHDERMPCGVELTPERSTLHR